MDRSPVCRGGSPIIWQSVVSALVLVVLVSATTFLTAVGRQDKDERALDAGRWSGVHRQRRDTGDVDKIKASDFESEISTPGVETGLAVTDLVPDKTGDYFPVYRQVGGRSIDWNSEQMSTDGFDVQSNTDFIDDDEDYDESASLEKDPEKDYDYLDDEEPGPETSKSSAADVQTDNSEELIGDDVNSSSLRGKEIADYYADFEDGQKFDEDEYETTFFKPGMHYGDNVEIVEQVITILFFYPSICPSCIKPPHHIRGHYKALPTVNLSGACL